MKGNCFNNHATESPHVGSHNQKKTFPVPTEEAYENAIFFRHLSAIALCLCTTTAFAAQAPSRTECIAPAKPGGGFDLTCKLIQVSLMETGAIEKTDARYLYARRRRRGGLQRHRRSAPGGSRNRGRFFSGGSLLNLSQGKFGRYGVDDVRWLASVGTDYGMIAVRADSPWKDLKSFMSAMEKKIPPLSSLAPGPPSAAVTG